MTGSDVVIEASKKQGLSFFLKGCGPIGSAQWASRCNILAGPIIRKAGGERESKD